MAHEYDEELEKVLCTQVINGEVNISEMNQQNSNDEFEECVSLLDA